MVNEPTKKARRITIANWAKYQGDEVDTDHVPTMNRPCTDYEPTTNKNERNKEYINVLDKSNTLSETDADFTVSTQSQSPKGEVEKVLAVWNECGKFRAVSRVTSTSKRGKITKKTQKTPKREIKKAKKELEELRERGV